MKFKGFLNGLISFNVVLNRLKEMGLSNSGFAVVVRVFVKLPHKKPLILNP